MDAPLAPTPVKHRIYSLDVLRGVAVLGILVINIRYFALPLRATNQPSWPGDGLLASDFWTWFFGTLFFEDKMIAIFSMLFGAGIVLTATRTVRVHLARQISLFAIGAAHAFFIWHGDVLMIYAVCGLLLTPVRRAPAFLLLPAGLLLVILAVGSRQWAPLVADLGPPLLQTDEISSTQPTEFEQRRGEAWGRLLRAETDAHLGSYADVFTWRAELNVWWHYYGGLFNLLRCGGFMLVGMALMRMRLFRDEHGWRFNVGLAASGLLLGGMLTLLGMHAQLTQILGSDDVTDRAALARLDSIGYWLRHLAAIPMSLGWIGLVFVFRRTPFL